jgi:uncharacterized repeat protein (TIGR02543 family)
MLLQGCEESTTESNYTVTYNANGGSGTAPSKQTVNEGSNVTVAGQGSLTYSGKTFSGWNTSSSGSGTAYTAGALLTVSENTTLYAQWTIITYTVTYNANGGSGTAPSVQTVNAGSSVTVSGQGSLINSGRTFSGWNTSSSGAGTAYTAGASLTVSGNTTLYAQWTTNAATTYTITYNANGGSGSTPSVQTVNAGSSVSIAGQGSLTYSGKTFSGWNTSSSGSGTAYTAGASLTVNGNTTLYAQWTTNAATTYTVTYNANGGSGSTPSVQTVNAGSSVTIAGQGSLTYSGKTFSGWNASSSGAGTAYTAGASLTVNGNTILYAQWTTNAATTYTVTYNANGGSGSTPSVQTVNAGSSVTIAGQGSLTYSGKTFSGWNTSSSGAGTAYTAGASLTVNGNTILYAQWERIATATVYFISKTTGYSPSGTKFGIGNLQFSGTIFNIALYSNQDVGSSSVDGPYTLAPGTYEVRFVEPNETCRPNWYSSMRRSTSGTSTTSVIDEEAVSFTFEGNKVYTVYYEHTNTTTRRTDSRTGNVRETITTNWYRLSVEEGTD